MDYRAKKLTAGAALASVLLTWAPCQAAQPVTDGVAAVVNDKVITLSEIRKEVEPQEQQYAQLYNGLELYEKIQEARLGALKALIEQQLIIQDFESNHYFMPPNVVDAQIANDIKERYGGDRAAFVKTLQARGISMDSFKELTKNRLIAQSMRNLHVHSAVIVSPYHIEQYYQDNIKQFVQPEQVKLRDIFMRKALYQEKRQDADGKEIEVDPQYLQMQEILSKVATGSDFANLAKSYSQGAQAANGGDLGWVSAASLRKELADAAFKLRPGQNSPIITTDDGYHILMVDEVKKSSVIALSQVRDNIENLLLQQERERLQQEWIDSLRAKAFIKMFF
ncbi:MAG: peptidyl-prolyl cis-trans isomerase [Verrucomicrobiales bacterium]|jgi:parvulin-like peptidyl-prolyl isomerase|nr:peptidyl-prolyl cis-trans isomerase [Verrucomicrobiales bacterium]